MQGRKANAVFILLFKSMCVCKFYGLYVYTVLSIFLTIPLFLGSHIFHLLNCIFFLPHSSQSSNSTLIFLQNISQITFFQLVVLCLETQQWKHRPGGRIDMGSLAISICAIFILHLNCLKFSFLICKKEHLPLRIIVNIV